MGEAVVELPKIFRWKSEISRDAARRPLRRAGSRWSTALFFLIGLLAQAPAARAQLLPFERNPAVPVDSQQTFVEGLRAAQSGDYAMAVGRLQLAATTLPAVGDYALFYLAYAQDGNGDRADAAATYRRVAEEYPQSVLADSAEVEYARLELALGHPASAASSAARVAGRTTEAGVEQNARMVEAEAAAAQAEFAAAYDAAQRLREDYPHGALDARARALAYSLLAAHPGLAQRNSLDYRLNEAALLVREGERTAALEQVDRALAIGPSPAVRAELYWLQAEASSGSDSRQRSALLRSLALAPGGRHAPAALKMLARMAWRQDDTASARHYFGEVASRFPSDGAEAMFEIGRTWEDDHELDAARAEFRRLISRYPASDYGQAARFRAPFMLYMQGRFDGAAGEFAAARATATAAADRDMFSYWQARALERAGQAAASGAIYRELARSVASNYYPMLAARRVGATPVALPAATAADPVAGSIPSATGRAAFHLERVAAFRAMGLRELEPAELRAIAGEPALRDFVLAEMQAAGAWYDAIQLTNAMLARGELDAATAERVRYPRGFWDLVSAQASREQLDPWLVAALIRQESLYNPQARSVSDARGLMQLLPTTAAHWAPAAGLSPTALDLYDPDVSVRIGTTYLKGLFNMFEGDPFKAVAAYNGGEHAVAGWLARYPGDDDQWVENIGYRETREYVKKVIGGMREYQLLYGARSADAAAAPPTGSSPG